MRFEEEITWLAELVNNTIVRLIDSNRPDRLHVQFYVTNSNANEKQESEHSNLISDHVITFDEKDGFNHYITKYNNYLKEEKVTLLTPIMKRTVCQIDDINKFKANDKKINKGYQIAKHYPLLGCRLHKGRPKWDKLFESWIHLYPK